MDGYTHKYPLRDIKETMAYMLPKVAAADSTEDHKERKLFNAFLKSLKTVEQLREGSTVVIDGHSLTIGEVAAVSRHGAKVTLTKSQAVREAVAASRRVIEEKMDEGMSVYGVTTGFGGSADTRTSSTLNLGSALLQHQQSGILPTETSATGTLPLLDSYASTSMPESWVRGAMLVRINSLIRGHSAVRWELIERIQELLDCNITPLVPLRGSISASGDLSPLSYIAGAVIGNPKIRVYSGPSNDRKIVPSAHALAENGIEPLPLQSKEHLGILNGTAFSASVAALALHEAAFLTLLGQVCTAMGVEALVGTQASFDPFIHDVARPHPGQVEAAGVMYDLLRGSTFAETEERELSISEDNGQLRQDRYPLRTAPQFIGPQLETVLTALDIVTQECNSTTDNPLIDGTTGHVHHGGNFQAMAVTSAMESTRLALHHVGKLLFAQSTELLNPTMNRGLPPSLAASNPSLNYHCKGLDIATAAYVGELGFLANPVSTHVQSAEMHNQAVNSLALISARKTIDAIQVLSMLTASYLYNLCQAMDLRAMQREFFKELDTIMKEELDVIASSQTFFDAALPSVRDAMHNSFEKTSTMDITPRMEEIAGCGMRALMEVAMVSTTDISLSGMQAFKSKVATRTACVYNALVDAYLSGDRGAAPASVHLKGTRPMYDFIRTTLGVPMHGATNHKMFANNAVFEDDTIGHHVSLIYESIRDGKMQGIVAKMVSSTF